LTKANIASSILASADLQGHARGLDGGDAAQQAAEQVGSRDDPLLVYDGLVSSFRSERA
jgi:hypothetical protein